MPKYEIEASRDDILPRIVGEFSAADDPTALILFEERYERKDRWAMDYLVLNKVVQEKKTELVKYSSPEYRPKE